MNDPAEPKSEHSSRKRRAQQFLGIQLLLVVAVTAIGLSWNRGWKFVRVKRSDMCDMQVLDIFNEHSQHCCTTTQSPEHAVMCGVAFSEFNRMLSTLWAWVLPLLPWAVNFALDSDAGQGHKAQRWKRLGLYLVIMFVRTFILYALLNEVQIAYQEEEASGCWYSEFTRDGKCREIFDFSDHVVLFVVQYICVASLEFVAVLLQPTATKWQQFAVLIPTFGLTAISLWYMTMTAAYFHTQTETLVGLVLAFGFTIALFGGLVVAFKKPGRLRRLASRLFVL